jgi:hypothetical protein
MPLPKREQDESKVDFLDNQPNVIEEAIGAVQLYSEIANLLIDILHTADAVNVGGATDYELKLMCVNKLKAIVEKIDV